MRKSIPINYEWYFLPDFRDEYVRADHSISAFENVRIPHTMKEVPFHHFDPEMYQFTGCYLRDLGVIEHDADEMVLIRFYGVSTACEVFLNGNSLGIHEGGYTPFEFDITEELIPGNANRLAVKVDGSEKTNVPPFGGVVDYLAYSGIYREVELEICPKDHIQNLSIWTEEAPSLSYTEMVLYFRFLFPKELTEADIKIKIMDQELEVAQSIYHEKVALVNHGTILIQAIERWDLDNPKLYDFELEILQNERVIDCVHSRFGFRTAQFTSEGFLLNNRKLKLIGLNRHQSYPYVGYAMPKRMQERDAEILKFELGCNIVRTSHYMQSDHFINRADEIGLLVFEEIPGWQTIGDEYFKNLSYENLRTMISHHFNHPSIILWGVRINESPDCHDFYLETNRIAHSLDESRQTAGVRNVRKSEFLEDVYTYNDFSHSGKNDGLANPNKVAGRLIPYLVTEHNGHMFPTRKSDSEERRIEQALRHMKVIDAAYQSDRIAGAIGWSFSDYNTHRQFGSQDMVCHHGVTDMFRIPKYASYPYMAQKKGDPVLKVASTLIPGDFENSMLPPTVIFSNCDFIEVYLDDERLGKYYTNWLEYPGVPHAPFLIDDYIGERLYQDSSYSRKVAKRIKRVLISYSQHGYSMPFSDQLRMANLIFFHKFTMKEAMDIYGKYLGNWGNEKRLFRFDGYVGDQKVISLTLGNAKKKRLKAYLDDPVLELSDTYDVTRLVVQMEDEYQQVLYGASDVIEIETDSLLSVIGPNKVALVGGSIGIYLKTNEKKGTAKVLIRASGFEPISLTIKIK